VNDPGLNLEDLDITKEMNLQVKHHTVAKYKSLATQPDEVEDMFLVVHYKLGNKS
jgi:hypothetical protein